MIRIESEPGSVSVEHIRYRETFTYAGNIYMRVDSHGFRRAIEKSLHRCISSGTGSLNTKEEVVVLRLSNGRLSYFRRETRVRRVDLVCHLENPEGDS